MTKERLNYLLTGEENPKFVSKRENTIIDKCLELLNDSVKVNIQVWQDQAKIWDDCKATIHTTKDSDRLAQAIADVTGHSVRLSFHRESTEAGRCNGSYFYPKTEWNVSPMPKQ